MPTYKREIRQDTYLDNRKPKYVEMSKKVLTATISVWTKRGELPPTAQRRIIEAAEEEMESYARTITTEVARLDKEINSLLKKGKGGDAERMIESTSKSVDNAFLSMQSAVDNAVDRLLKKETQADANLREARLKIAYDATKITLAATVLAAEMIASGPVAPAFTPAFAMQIYDIVSLIRDTIGFIEKNLKSADSKRNDLLEAMGKYFTTKTRIVIHQGKLADNGIAWTSQEESRAERALDSKIDKVESARKIYRNEVTALRHKVDRVSTKVGELTSKLNRAKNDKLVRKMQERLAVLEIKSRGLEAKYRGWNTFAEDMEGLLKMAGYESDDTTLTQKIRRLKMKPQEVLEFVADAALTAADMYSIGKAMVEISRG